jgi:hypothetical protein
MIKSRLPPIPDFEGIESFAAATVDQRARVFELVGDLNFAWANNESLLIYFTMLLLRTDEISAAIVFATLNTTRARLDLVERLAKAHLREADLRKRLAGALDEFAALTRIRNEFNHCTFVVGVGGELTDTQTLKLQESRGRLSFGVRRPIDDRRLAELSKASAELKALNRRLWQIMPAIEVAMDQNPNGSMQKA